jgi:hypothetical protein
MWQLVQLPEKEGFRQIRISSGRHLFHPLVDSATVWKLEFSIAPDCHLQLHTSLPQLARKRIYVHVLILITYLIFHIPPNT